MDPNRVIIFDTTLRDGEQSPGISLNATEKLEIAQQLARLGVDVIEAGFPIASPGDFQAVQTIAREVHGPVIAGLARAHAAPSSRAWRSCSRPIHLIDSGSVRTLPCPSPGSRTRSQTPTFCVIAATSMNTCKAVADQPTRKVAFVVAVMGGLLTSR